jgi:lambda family phage portal protein
VNIFRRFLSFFKRTLKAASIKRVYSSWTTKANTPNADMPDIALARTRANYLFWNDTFIRGAVDTLVDKIVGAGTTPQARTKNKDFNRQAEEAFKEWSGTADIHNQFHFGDIERTIIQKLFLDGGVFIKPVVDNKRKNPFALEILEYDRLADNAQGKGQNQIIHGVEIDQNGEVVAYHFTAGHANDLTTSLNYKTKRILAKNIIHFSPFRRPGQILGIPLLAPAIPYAYHLNDIVEAELISKKIEATFGIVIKTPDVSGRLSGAALSEEDQEREISLEPGMVEFLQPGEEIEPINPNRPGKNFKDFTYFILSGIARSLGLSLEQITGDKSQTNYSSARHSELELRAYIKPFRAADERYFLTPIWRKFIEYAIVAGILKAPGYVKDSSDYKKHEWIFVGHDWVDPLKEVNAKTKELEINATTLSEICAAKGKDWQDVAKQRAAEIKFLKENGVQDEEKQILEAVNGQ